MMDEEDGKFLVRQLMKDDYVIADLAYQYLQELKLYRLMIPKRIVTIIKEWSPLFINLKKHKNFNIE
ncbi:MAG: hypothetical protein ACLRQF_18930 [Thomasclavelia ramosa]